VSFRPQTFAKVIVLGTIFFSAQTIGYSASVFFAPAAKLMYGNLSSPNASIPSRAMALLGVEAILGTPVLNPFLLGIRGHYTWATQLKSANSLDNSNMQGSNTGLGVAAGFQFGKIQLLGFYDFYARYTPSFATSSGETITFAKPKSFGGAIRYKGVRTFYGIEYFQSTYQSVQFESSTSPEDVTFGDDAHLKLWGVGFSIGAFFN